ncbi:MAG: response regulator, partial [Anaerolineae bacterium]|nr:response regulator [Anaerolineae bacterium]
FAVVAASTGEAGRQLVANKHSLPIQEGKSIIGTVTHTGEALVVNDVTQDPTHRPHPLLPDTRAELGIPMIVGNRITGAMDVQSTRTNAFSEDDIAVLRTLADQIAVAVENARSFELAQDAVDEMREIDRIKSEFLANMSHELRTPLNSIIGFSRVILKGIDGPINELQQQDLEAIHNSGQHLLDMINNILDLSKIEAGKMELSIEEIELKDIFDGVISTARGLVKEKNLQLLDNTGDSLPTVLADRTRVRQILLNLLQNATKFTDEGKIEVNFETITDPDSGMELGQISVTDSGIGISQEDQEKLFERFSQVDSSLTRKVGGSGLGLSITQHLVEMQGGKIWLKSKEGEGSTFYFTLPIANPTTGIKVQQPEVITGDKIIVSIDDDSKVIDLYKRYLNTHGYQVVAITNPQEALTQIKQIKPHAITVDIMMPSRDGWQVIGDIKSDPATQNIPIIICSIVDDQERGFNLGAADYLVKPILEDEFVTTIKSLKLNGDSAQNNILIIDDDPNILQLVEKAVRNDPSLRFKFAQGGVKGLNSIRQERPDAVLLDLFMPDLDGFSVLETLKSDIELKEIPIIILTSAELGDEERQRIEQYKQEFLQKDGLQDEDLVACLHRALQKINKG